MRSLRLVWLGGALLIGTFSGCQNNHHVRLAADNWPGNAPLSLADYLQYYDCPEYHLDIVQLPSVQAIEEGLISGEFDGGTLTLVEAVMLKDRGHDIEVLFPFDYSSGADGLVAQQDIKSISDLRGKRVGAELETVSHYFLLEALESAGLGADDVEIVNLEASQSAAAFAARDVDACATWEPALSEIIRRFDAQLLFSSRDIPGRIVDVLVLKKDAMRDHPELAGQLLRGWDRALDYLHDNDSAATAIMAAEIRVSPQEFRDALVGIELLRSDEMEREELDKRSEDVRRFLARKGMVTRRPDALALVPTY